MTDIDPPTVLCYGDSNTYGAIPDGGGRYRRAVRWPGVVQHALGARVHVVEEGLSGRTTVWDDPVEEGLKSGRMLIDPCLATHAPVALVVVMLGTNDLKQRYAVPASDIADGAGTIAGAILRSDAGPDGAAPKVLLVAPPEVGPFEGDRAEKFMGAEAKAAAFPAHYKRVAADLGCDVLDAAEVVRSSPRDGVHLEADAHRALGEAIARKIAEALLA